MADSATQPADGSRASSLSGPSIEAAADTLDGDQQQQQTQGTAPAGAAEAGKQSAQGPIEAPLQPAAAPDSDDAQQPSACTDQKAAGSSSGDPDSVSAAAQESAEGAPGAQMEAQPPPGGAAPSAGEPSLEILLFLNRLPHGMDGCR